MKTTGIIVCVFLFMGIVSQPLQAQEAPAMPENFFVIEEFVQPADMPAFTKVQQAAVDQWNKLGFEFPVYAYQTGESSYYWVVPIENFASLDKLFAAANELTGKMKEAGFDTNKEFRDLSTARQTTIHWNKDLSYHPNGDMGQTADKPYCEWTFIYLKAGHEQDVAAVAKKYQEFYNSVEETIDWDIYTVGIGFDTPCWILMYRAENPVVMRENDAAIQQKHSEKLGELWTSFVPHVRKIENQTGWFLPRWSLNYQQ